MARRPAPPAQSESQSKESPPDLGNGLKEEIDRQIGPLVNQHQRGEIVTRVLNVLYQERFSGPIAHPRHLRAYEDIVPGSAERIIRMAEKAQDHNAEMDRVIVNGQIEDQKRGMRYGLFALLIILGFAGLFGYLGQEIIAGLFLTTAVLGAIPVFVRGRAPK